MRCDHSAGHQSKACAAPAKAPARQAIESESPAVVAARSQIGAARWERRAAYSDLFTPSLNGSINYTRFSDPFFNFGTAAISKSATSATLDASYTILGFSKYANVKRSNALLESAQAAETLIHFRSSFATDGTCPNTSRKRRTTRPK